MAAFSRNLVAGNGKEGNPGPLRGRIGIAPTRLWDRGVPAPPIMLSGNAGNLTPRSGGAGGIYKQDRAKCKSVKKVYYLFCLNRHECCGRMGFRDRHPVFNKAADVHLYCFVHPFFRFLAGFSGSNAARKIRRIC